MNNRIIEYQKQWGLGNMQVFSYGNTKLPKHTLIVNLTSATNCPSEQLGFCKCNDICYAKKCERIYKAYKNKTNMIGLAKGNKILKKTCILFAPSIFAASSNSSGKLWK